MRNQLYIIILLLLIFSCEEQSLNQKIEDTRISQKGEYKSPVNTAYDSISKVYKSVEPFDSIYFLMGFIQPGSKSFICLDRTMLMKDTLMQIPTNILLDIGDSIIVEYSINTEYKHQYWSEPVYKVIVTKKGKKYEGYLLQSTIAILFQRLEDGNILMARIADMVKSNEYGGDFYTEILITDSLFKVLNQKKYKLLGGEDGEDMHSRYYYSIEAQLRPAVGIEGAVNVIDLSMYYPACGYTGGNMVLIWDGTNLHHAFQDYDASDAGVYSMYSEYVLPTDSTGKKNCILSYTNTVSYEFDANEQYNELEHDSLVIEYLWKKNEGIIKMDTIFSGKK